MKFIKFSITALLFVAGLVPAAFAQSNGSIGGQIQDTLGAVVVGATVTVVAPDGKEKTATSNQRGEFNVTGLVAGTYTVKVKATNFALYENAEVAVTAGERAELIVPLTVEGANEQVEVSEGSTVSLDPANNASATVLKKEELDALPDDPEELEAALQALAGGSAGPNGGQIYIDGFTGGNLPPKEAIREIRINNNPFSAEYDRPGFGRIEILTKPGADKFRGSAFGNFNDESLNARNPFSTNRAPSQTRFFGGNFSGPIVKGKSSFFIDVNKRDNDSNSVVNAVVLDSGLNPVKFQEEFQVPNRRFSISPRFDYAINDNNTLVVRYSYSNSSSDNQGIGGITLPSRASESSNWEHELRFTETMIINPKTVNETRFEVDWEKNNRFGDNSIPAITVSEAFSGGGATIGQNFSRNNSWDLQNYTTTSLGRNSEHSFKFGARIRRTSLTDRSENGFGGSFSFAGSPAFGLTPIDQYIGAVSGLTGEQYIPTQYSVTIGNPEQKVSRTDYSLFVTNDWKINPSLMFSAGLRYENQTNISDNANFAPRFAVAWSPTSSASKQAPFVLRGAFGMFYDRFSENTTLQALRFNGAEQQNLVVSINQADPLLRAAAVNLLSQPIFTLNGVTNVPTAQQILSALPQSNIPRQIASDFRVPVTYQGAISIERQFPRNTRTSLTYMMSQTNNVMRMRNINAPICPEQFNCGGAPIPFPGSGPIYEYESTGTMRMNRLNFNMSSMFTRGFTLFGNYSLGFSENDGDGGFPAYSYDLTDEWGRAGFDTRHSFVVGGNIQVPWGISLSPFINYNSGRAFNITTGVDSNADRQFLERPTFAQLGARCDQLGLTYSYCDVSGYDPDEIIPRNFGRSPQFFNVNIRVGKNFGFGKTEGGSSAGNNGGGGRGGNRGGGQMGGGGGPRMVMMGGGGGGFFGGGERKPYNLNVSVNFNNLLNHPNFDSPVGNLASSRFGEYTRIAGGFGRFGGGGGGERRIELQLRFSW